MLDDRLRSLDNPGRVLLRAADTWMAAFPKASPTVKRKVLECLSQVVRERRKGGNRLESIPVMLAYEETTLIISAPALKAPLTKF